MTTIETRPHDVLIIGAGGAGLRAAVACIEAGLSVGVVCKSLLGKAHTVMAEGGMAASLAHVDDRDGWITIARRLTGTSETVKAIRAANPGLPNVRLDRRVAVPVELLSGSGRAPIDLGAVAGVGPRLQSVAWPR